MTENLEYGEKISQKPGKDLDFFLLIVVATLLLHYFIFLFFKSIVTTVSVDAYNLRLKMGLMGRKKVILCGVYTNLIGYTFERQFLD